MSSTACATPYSMNRLLKIVTDSVSCEDGERKLVSKKSGKRVTSAQREK